jgi:hypothetical protein
MKLNPKTIDRSGQIPTFFITPVSMVFKNTVRYGWFKLFKKTKEVHLRWITIRTEAGKSFAPVFETDDGYKIPNRAVAENYLERDIVLPKVVSVIKHIHHEGYCSICERFHMEDNGQIIMLIGTEDCIEPEVQIEEDDTPQSKCSDADCTGWYPKKTVVS